MSCIYQEMELTNIASSVPANLTRASYETLAGMISNSLLDSIDANLFNVEMLIAGDDDNARYHRINTVFLCNKAGGIIASSPVTGVVTTQFELEDIINELMRKTHGGSFRVDVLITDLKSGSTSKEEVFVQSGHYLAAANDAIEWVAENFFGEKDLSCAEIDGVVNELAEEAEPIIFTTKTKSCEILKIEKIR